MKNGFQPGTKLALEAYLSDVLAEAHSISNVHGVRRVKNTQTKQWSD
jgi:hypothetical protein